MARVTAARAPARLMPARTPNVIVSKVLADVVGVIRQREVHERFAAQGLDVIGTSTEEFAAYLKAEVSKWSRVILVAGLSPT